MTELRNVDADIWQFRQRVIVIALTVLFAFGLIVARMTWLQVTRHEEFMAQAESNRTAVLPVVPCRVCSCCCSAPSLPMYSVPR